MCAGRTTTSILAALVLAIGATPALGEQAPAPVAVLGLTAPPDQVELLAALSTSLRGAAVAAGRSAPTSEELRSSGALALSQDGAAGIAEARRLARELYLRFDFEGARATLEGARRELLERYADLSCQPELSDVDLELSDLLLNVRDQLGREAEAEAFSLLLEVARCSPELEPSPDVLGPRVIAAWSAVRGHEALPAGADLPPRNIQRLARAGAAAGADAVITGALSRGYDGSVTARLTVIRVETAEAAAEEEVTLGPQPGWEQTLQPVLRRLLAAARPTPPQPPAPPTGTILVLSSPPGASIVVDDEPRSEVTPAVITVSPGQHDLALRLADYDEELISVTAWPDQTQPVEVRLSGRHNRLGRRLWWLWTAIGVSLAGAAAGVVAWAVTSSQERPDLTVNVDIAQ